MNEEKACALLRQLGLNYPAPCMSCIFFHPERQEKPCSALRTTVGTDRTECVAKIRDNDKMTEVEQLVRDLK